MGIVAVLSQNADVGRDVMARIRRGSRISFWQRLAKIIDVAHWNTAADGSGTSYSPAPTFSITVNTTLYAI